MNSLMSRVEKRLQAAGIIISSPNGPGASVTYDSPGVVNVHWYAGYTDQVAPPDHLDTYEAALRDHFVVRRGKVPVGWPCLIVSDKP